MLVRRHLTIVLPDGALRSAIEAMRARWDPVMAARVPAHASVVYPEEVTDESLLLDRIEREVRELRSFPVDVRGFATGDDGQGVFLRVSDRTGVLTELRQRLLAPPFSAIDYPFHVTIVHPRTSDRSPEAFAALHSDPIAGSVCVSTLRFTETSAEGMTVLQQFELGSPRAQQVAAVLRRGAHVLLCHRSPRREYFPDTWDLPGGHVEPGEHAADALARELQEELGIVVSDVPDLPDRVFSDDTFDVDLAVWFLDRWNGEPTNAAPDEHDGLEWCASEDWVRRPLAHPSYQGLLAEALRD